ncbi:MAG: histidine phosphatase family protein [Acidobacteria bacterium]|nr:histidine phosphatase family protein [Acidobacteriota bacterium]
MPAEITLVLVRHAIAEERGSAWPDDDERPLSRDGEKKWKRGAKGLATVLPEVDLLLCSPLRRTRQTADVLAPALATPARVELFDALRPETRPTAVIAALKTRRVHGVVVLIGHDPMLPQLAATLLHLEGPLEFRKGGALALVTQGLGARGPSRLEWFVTPRMLRALAG